MVQANVMCLGQVYTMLDVDTFVDVKLDTRF